jgi:hypothetical protein
MTLATGACACVRVRVRVRVQVRVQVRVRVRVQVRVRVRATETYVAPLFMLYRKICGPKCRKGALYVFIRMESLACCNAMASALY